MAFSSCFSPAWSGKWWQPGQQLNPVTVAWEFCPTVSIDTEARKTVREVTALAEIFTKVHVLPLFRAHGQPPSPTTLLSDVAA